MKRSSIDTRVERLLRFEEEKKGWKDIEKSSKSLRLDKSEDSAGVKREGIEGLNVPYNKSVLKVKSFFQNGPKSYINKKYGRRAGGEDMYLQESGHISYFHKMIYDYHKQHSQERSNKDVQRAIQRPTKLFKNFKIDKIKQREKGNLRKRNNKISITISNPPKPQVFQNYSVNSRKPRKSSMLSNSSGMINTPMSSAYSNETSFQLDSSKSAYSQVIQWAKKSEVFGNRIAKIQHFHEKKAKRRSINTINQTRQAFGKFFTTKIFDALARDGHLPAELVQRNKARIKRYLEEKFNEEDKYGGEQDQNGYFGYEDPDFWYRHGFHLSKEKHIGRIKNVRKKMAKEFLKGHESWEILYGISLCNLMLGRYKESLDMIYQVSAMKKHSDRFKAKFLYLAALNNRKLGYYSDANVVYNQLIKITKYEDGRYLIKYTMGLILVPLVEDRNKITGLIESLSELIDFYCIDEPQDYISVSYSYEAEKWLFKENAISYLKTLKFFERFTTEELGKDVLPFLKLKKYKKDEIIFPDGKHVYIIISGDVILRSHEEKISPCKILARFRQGDVIGSECDLPQNLKLKDEGEVEIAETLKVENWCVVRCPTVTAVLKIEDFNRIFDKISRIRDRFVKIPEIQSIHLFTHLSKITLHRILDIMKVVELPAGALISAQTKSSKFNFAFLNYNMKNSIISIDNKKHISTDADILNRRNISFVMRIFKKETPEASEESIHSDSLSDESFLGPPKKAKQSFSKLNTFSVSKLSKVEFVNKPKQLKRRVAVRMPIHKTFDSENDGVYIVSDGICVCKNRSDNFEVTKLVRGDYWGEGSILTRKDFTEYGDIFAETQVELMWIPINEFKQLNVYELFIMMTQGRPEKYIGVEYTIKERYENKRKSRF
ncbi:unnamed protein product [Moneuplotes crassus]|uniref:Cyclic nucleotide-binding domain-containing protein n=1 Tax=Euplotes crassus TaxID=5936 RepID=A0AAD1XU71_EUPCR|nr:unnamed protein product [Moneuplotes crassus]